MEKYLRPSSLNDIGVKRFVPAIVFFLVVVILICLPEEDLPTSHEWMEITFLDKWIHAAMFAIMTFLFLLPVAQSSLFKQQKRHYFIRICLAAFIWGLTTEYIQGFYVPTRAFDLIDWFADGAGILIAFFYCRKFHSS